MKAMYITAIAAVICTVTYVMLLILPTYVMFSLGYGFESYGMLAMVQLISAMLAFVLTAITVILLIIMKSKSLKN